MESRKAGESAIPAMATESPIYKEIRPNPYSSISFVVTPLPELWMLCAGGISTDLDVRYTASSGGLEAGGGRTAIAAAPAQLSVRSEQPPLQSIPTSSLPLRKK